MPLLFLLLLNKANAQDAVSVGPMVHFNFGDKKPRVSWGVEAAVWWLEGERPISANLGFDRRAGSTIIYSQAQTGILIAGLSLGPFIELRKEEKPLVGLQTDFWANYFAGVNYRTRVGGGGFRHALGGYAKLPMGPFWKEDGEDELWEWDWD